MSLSHHTQTVRASSATVIFLAFIGHTTLRFLYLLPYVNTAMHPGQRHGDRLPKPRANAQ